MTITLSRVVIVALSLGLMAAATGPVSAQGRRGGRGGQPLNLGPDIRSRMELLTDGLSLTDDQQDAVRARMDAAHKTAAPIRADLVRHRAALAAAAAKAAGGSDITTAAAAYADAATAMTELEMRTLAEILALVTPEQKKQGTAAAFYLMRGIFLDEKKWNDTPNGRLY